MGRICRNLLTTTLVVLAIQLSFCPLTSLTKTAEECMPEDDVLSLLNPENGKHTSVEQFCRLLPVAFGLVDEFPYNLPRDTLVIRLKATRLIHKSVDVNFEKPLTKGLVSVILVKTLVPNKSSLVERLLISVFASQKACFRVALREKLIPPGNAEDMITSRELAAIMLAIAVLTESNPLPEADIHCIRLFAGAIVEKVVSIEEVKEILDMEDPNSIKGMLAM